MSTFWKAFTSPDSEVSLVVEDDGRVAYAYLRSNNAIIGNAIIGDVWLYNQAPSPEMPEWKDRSKAPYLNPQAYVDQPSSFQPLTHDSEIDVQWLMEGGHTVGAVLLIRGQCHAVVRKGEKPGASRFARHDGPLAKLLQNHPSYVADNDKSQEQSQPNRTQLH